jgi:5-methyltetrahydrofolate--homocysteine methyltransferase
MNDLYTTIEMRGVLLGDGAMGTMLQDHGLTDGGAPELWNVERPEEIEAILEGYAAAGAQYLTTNTFGGTAARLQLHGLDDRVEELNRAGAAVARRVADRYGILVAGDVGPTGEILFPLGVLTEEEAQAMFAAQVRGLKEGGADFILIETMSAIEEVGAAVAAVREVDPDQPIAATMSFDTNLRTMMGISPAMAVERIAAMGVRVIGANCGRGPVEMTTIAEQMVGARAEGVYLMVQSNAGLPYAVGDEFRYDGTPAVMADWAGRMRDLGIEVIGACCGSTPEHVAAMRDALSTPA